MAFFIQVYSISKQPLLSKQALLARILAFEFRIQIQTRDPVFVVALLDLAWLTLLPAMSIALYTIIQGSFSADAPVKWLAIALALLSLIAMLVPVKDFFGSR